MLAELDEQELDDCLNEPIDKFRVPPIHQKRLLAFVNNFVLETVDFLNNLILSCDAKFIVFETKLQKVEDSLAILEGKLSSVAELTGGGAVSDPSPESITQTTIVVPERPNPQEGDSNSHSTPPSVISAKANDEQTPPTIQSATETKSPQDEGVKACEDYRYKKFFKMTHFGVPPPAVKNKMSSEGLNPDILDSPNMILADGQRTPPPQSDEDDDEESS